MGEGTPVVLIVDDDDDIRDAIVDVASRAGFVSVTARNGFEALRHLAGERLPDLVLLDMMMPVMDGWEFLRRRDERGRTVPVVVLTAADQDRIPTGVPALRKPITVELLLDALVSYCR